MPDPGPAVAVWKARWLSPSETFVRDQLASMTRWRPLRVGLWQVPGGIARADRAPFPGGALGRVARRASAATGHRWLYDDLLRSEDVRLVHAHFGTSAVEVLPVARRLGLPLAVTFHGFDVTLEPFRGRDGARYRQRLSAVFDYASSLIAVSEHLAGRLVDLGAPAEKVRVHHIGIPVDRVSSTEARRDGVVFVGRLVDVKGPKDLLAALTLLARAGTPVPLRVVGEGPLRDRIVEGAREGGVPLTMLGRRSSDEVAAELARAAVFCGPSRTSEQGQEEAFGIVFLEAALHGLPVVAYRHGGVPEAVVDGVTGLLASEGDVEGLAARIRALIADPDQASALGAAGRARVLAQFDVRTQTALLEDIYDEVAGVRPTRGR